MSNGLDPAKLERLIMASEEGAEIVSVTTKIIRRGIHDSRYLNIELLRKEIIDVLAMIHVLVNHGDINSITSEEIEQAMKDKLGCATHQTEPEKWTIRNNGLPTQQQP